MKQHDAAATTPRRGPRTWTEARTEARRRRQERVRDLQHDERFDRLRTLPARRTLVVVGYLLTAATAALGLADLGGLLGVLTPVVFLVGIGVAFVLHRTLRETVDAPDEVLDERLIAARDAAHRTAYRIVVSGILVVLFTMLLAGGTGFEVEQRHLEALLWSFALAAMLTPTAVRAWTEPEV